MYKIHTTPRDNHWGHAIDWFDFNNNRVVGWLNPLPSVGDEFHSEMQSGKVARFRFVTVEPTGNPRDMFFSTVEFIDYV